MEKYLKSTMTKKLMKESYEAVKRYDLIISVKNNYKDNQDQYFINCLTVGDTDVEVNELSEGELKLLNELQRLNIALISKGSLENSKRKEILSQHALNFKTINY